MKFSRTDIPLMRLSLAAICASALLSGAILYGSNRYAEQNQIDLRNAQRQLNDARKRLSDARNDRENLSVYSAEYGALEEQNIIGDDHRLDWMEDLEKLRRQNLVVDFRFNIAPQKIYAPQPAIDSGNFNIHYSEMKLQFDLLHEGQLLKFLDALRSQIKGQYLLEGCKLQRSETVVNAGMPMINIKAECSGGWITLKNRSAPQ
ncbi:MAG: hypothetical protein ACYCY7_07355 [Gallionella sp.]